MILKKYRIRNGFKFLRIRYNGYNICNKRCIGRCSPPLSVYCNEIYQYNLKEYCYIYDSEETGSY